VDKTGTAFKQTLYRWKIRKKPGWEPSIALQHGVQVRCVILRRTRLWKVYVQTPNSDGHQHTSTVLFFDNQEHKLSLMIKDFLKWESFSPNKKQAQLASRVKIKATRQPGIRRFLLKSNEDIESSENGQI